MTPVVIRSVDEIPTVCLEEDLGNIFRLSLAQVRRWRRAPDLLPFPPLPWLDRHVRVSGWVVAWFLAQESYHYDHSFRAPLEKQAAANRRQRLPWWRFTAPHERRFWATPLDGERATLSVDDVAQTLRAGASCLRRAVKDPEFPIPSAVSRPLRWTPGQVQRLLWAPQDHEEHLQQARAAAAWRRRRS